MPQAIKWVWLMPLLSILAACGTATILENQEDLLAYQAREGKLAVLKNLTVPAEKYRIYLQRGEIVTNVDIIEPHCDLELKYKEPKETTVKREQFSVIGINLDEEKLSGNFARASAALGPMRLFTTQLYLTSKKGTDVIRFNCAKMDDPGASGYISLKEFETIVGPYFELIKKK